MSLPHARAVFSTRGMQRWADSGGAGPCKRYRADPEVGSNRQTGFQDIPNHSTLYQLMPTAELGVGTEEVAGSSPRWLRHLF